MVIRSGSAVYASACSSQPVHTWPYLFIAQAIITSSINTHTDTASNIKLNKNTLCVKKVRGQSEAALQTGATKNFDIS